MAEPEDRMGPEDMATVAARDQLWAGLRALGPEIERLADGAFDGTERQRQVVQLLARIVSAELAFRAGQTP